MCALQLNMCVHHTEIETRECRRSDADEPNPEGFVPRRRQEWRACGLDTWTGGRRLPLRRTNYLPRGRADRPNDRLFARSRRGLWSLGCQRGSLDRRRARVHRDERADCDCVPGASRERRCGDVCCRPSCLDITQYISIYIYYESMAELTFTCYPYIT